jgi:copper chaperone
MPVTTRWTVVGMTCGHCVAAVDDEVRRLDGVTAVDVDLASGSLAVTSEAPLPAEAVAVAVAEAGYDVVP